MTSASTQPPLIAPNPANIPPEMRAARRWAPWRAEWIERKQKYTKIPHRAARPEYGLSNKNQTGWATFDEAMAAYRAHPDKFAGVGYLMTGAHGLVGVDLDHCVKDGVIDEWAREIIAKLDSYTEVSPSGTGLHVMVAGDVDADWTNHDRGIEVYGGNEARFLCITGERVPGSPATLRAPRAGVFDELATRYRRAPTRAEVEDLHLPDLVPLELLPDLSELDLPPHAANFLAEGPAPGTDRSQQLFATAIALAQAGLARDEVLSVLEANDHAMEIALDHRRQDYDKALRYLWKQHGQAGVARAEGLRQDQFDAFDDMGDDSQFANSEREHTDVPAAEKTAADDFEVLPEDTDAPPARPAKVKKPRFAPETAAQFLNHAAPAWIVKGVLPRAGLAVIYGASSSGKTFFTLDLVAAVARGVPWRGMPTRKGRVLYVVAEGAGGFRNRLQAYCEANMLDPAELEIMFLRQAPNLMTKEDIKEFLAQVVPLGRFDVIVIDTYARAMAGGNENDAKDVGLAVAHCEVIHRKTGALVVLVHHSGKDATKGARGSGALRAAADLEIEVVQTREYRAATVTKQKDGADGAEYLFNLAEVVIGMDDDNDLISSCVVAHSEASASSQPRKANPEGVNEKIVFRYMEGVENGVTSREELIENTLDMVEPDTAPGAKDRRKERIGRAIKSLVRKNLLDDDGSFVSLR